MSASPANSGVVNERIAMRQTARIHDECVLVISVSEYCQELVLVANAFLAFLNPNFGGIGFSPCRFVTRSSSFLVCLSGLFLMF